MNELILNGTYTLGNKMLTKEPLAIVTRNNDQEWTDVINWVIRALLFGEEHNLMQNKSLCDAKFVPVSSQFNFLNAVFCVGNYGELFDKHYKDPNARSEMNEINKGTAMLYAIPFGDIQYQYSDFGKQAPDAGTIFGNIKDSGVLKCGVIDSESTNLTRMSVDYCYMLAAAVFDGDFKSANIVHFTESDSRPFQALGNGTIDVIAGGRVDLALGRENYPSLGKLIFSTPYFYGHDEAK